MDDVRDVLEFYRQFDDPIEAFRENQRKLQEEMESQKAHHFFQNFRASEDRKSNSVIFSSLCLLLKK